MNNLQKKFKEQFQEGQTDVPLRKHSTFQIGGPADFFYHLKDNKDLMDLINFANENELPYLIIGAGTNILFDDEGFRGLIIKIDTDDIEIKDEQITTDAGIKVARLVLESMKNGLEGLEKWMGLPGSIGGAVRGNAGCNGLETKDILIQAKIFDPKTGKIKEVGNKYFKFSYRHSILKENEEILLSATFQLEKSTLTPEEQKELITTSSQIRFQRQPNGLSAGSFFKNPSPDQPAGMLIEQADLKGKTIGSAQISKKHANFIINLGGASSKDIIALADLAKQQVKDKFGITLQEEVQVIGPTGLLSC